MTGESFNLPAPDPEPTGDPWEHPETKRWAHAVRTDMLPKLLGSAATVSLITENAVDAFDVKIAVEIGATLLAGKPLILAVFPGVQAPAGLVAAAAAVVEYDPADPTAVARLRAALDDVL